MAIQMFGLVCRVTYRTLAYLLAVGAYLHASHIRGDFGGFGSPIGKLLIVIGVIAICVATSAEENKKS